MTFTTRLLTEAAHGGLKPPPTKRLRRVHLHLSYSMTLARLLDTTLSFASGAKAQNQRREREKCRAHGLPPRRPCCDEGVSGGSRLRGSWRYRRRGQDRGRRDLSSSVRSGGRSHGLGRRTGRGG